MSWKPKHFPIFHQIFNIFFIIILQLFTIIFFLNFFTHTGKFMKRLKKKWYWRFATWNLVSTKKGWLLSFDKSFNTIYIKTCLRVCEPRCFVRIELNEKRLFAFSFIEHNLIGEYRMICMFFNSRLLSLFIDFLDFRVLKGILWRAIR